MDQQPFLFLLHVGALFPPLTQSCGHRAGFPQVVCSNDTECACTNYPASACYVQVGGCRSTRHSSRLPVLQFKTVPPRNSCSIFYVRFMYSVHHPYIVLQPPLPFFLSSLHVPKRGRGWCSLDPARCQARPGLPTPSTPHVRLAHLRILRISDNGPPFLSTEQTPPEEGLELVYLPRFEA